MWKNAKGDNQGTSMITVVISFVILTLFMVGYLKAQRLAENMMMDSKDHILNNGQLIRGYYLGETDNSLITDHSQMQFKGKDGSFFVYASLSSARMSDQEGTIYYYGTAAEDEDIQKER